MNERTSPGTITVWLIAGAAIADTAHRLGGPGATLAALAGLLGLICAIHIGAPWRLMGRSEWHEPAPRLPAQDDRRAYTGETIRLEK